MDCRDLVGYIRSCQENDSFRGCSTESTAEQPERRPGELGNCGSPSRNIAPTLTQECDKRGHTAHKPGCLLTVCSHQ